MDAIEVRLVRRIAHLRGELQMLRDLAHQGVTTRAAIEKAAAKLVATQKALFMRRQGRLNYDGK